MKMCNFYDLKIEAITPNGNKATTSIEALYQNFIHRYKKEVEGAKFEREREALKMMLYGLEKNRKSAAKKDEI